MNASRERSFGCISPVKQNPRRPSASPGKPQRPTARLMHPKGRGPRLMPDSLDQKLAAIARHPFRAKFHLRGRERVLRLRLVA